jgi:hypothetical protein
MNSKADSIKRTSGTLIAAALPLSAMYLVWGMAIVLMRSLGQLHIPQAIHPFIIPVSVILFMMIASFVTEIFIVYVDDYLTEIPFLRAFMLMWTAVVAISVYLVTTRAGIKGHVVSGFGTANLLVFACLCATWMTTGLKQPSELVPVCAVVALADLFSVLAGPTKHLAEGIAAYYEKGMEGPPPFTDYILIKITVPGISIPMPLFGVSDWLILVFFCSAMVKFGLNDSIGGMGIAAINERKRLSFYFPVAAIGLAVAVLSAQVTGLFLPALPIMVLFFLGHSLWSHEGMRRLSAKEWRLLIVFSVVMISILVSALYFRS